MQMEFYEKGNENASGRNDREYKTIRKRMPVKYKG